MAKSQDAKKTAKKEDKITKTKITDFIFFVKSNKKMAKRRRFFEWPGTHGSVNG